jgi:outer membrane protein TolC
VRSHLIATIALAASIVLAPRPLEAQEGLALRLALEDAIERAMEASHRLAEASARQTAALAGVAVRQAQAMPSLTASTGYTRTNHVLEFRVPSPTGAPRLLYPDVPNNVYSRLELRWAIYTAGRADALERTARAEADAAGAEASVARADLRLEVTRAYWAVVTAGATVQVLDQGVARSQAHVAEVTARARAGLVPPNELASAEAQEARARMLSIEARNQHAVATAELARLVGIEPDRSIEPTTPLEIAPTSILEASKVPPPDGALVARARAGRQERVALEHRVAAADGQRSLAAAGRRPTISVSGSVDYSRPNPRIFPRADRWDESWDAGVGVSWSPWDGGRAAADIAQATAVVTAARQRLAEFDSVLAVEVRQRVLETQSTRAALAAAESAVGAAREARRVVDERYRAGVIGQIDLLDAEFALLQAELDRTRAQSAVRLADARLARTLGQ